MFENFALGMFVGFLIALPTGPVGILCIRKTLVYGKISGLLSVFGSVFADTFFSLVVLFSLTYISSFFIRFSLPLQFIGGIVFLLIAHRAMKLVIHDNDIVLPLKTPIEDFLSTFTLTFTNPTFIFSLSFIFALFNLTEHTQTLFLKSITLGGIAFGALAWWIAFILIVDYIHRKHHKISLQTINKFSAYILGIVGIFFLFIAVAKLLVLFIHLI